MKRQASAKWNGTIQGGSGWLSTESGVLEKSPYSFSSRFAEGTGTNPEELIGAAHAGCFSMAFSGILEKAGFKPESIDTQATVTVDKVDGNFAITKSHLKVEATVPGLDEAKFKELAEDAKKNCPVSKLMKAELTMEATLKTATSAKPPGPMSH